MKYRISRLFVCSLLATFAVASTLFCVISAFNLSVNSSLLIIATLLSCLIFTAGFQCKKLIWTLVPTVAFIIALIMFGGIQMLSCGIQQLLHDILTKFSSAYKNISFSIPAEPAGFTRGCFTLLFTCIAYLLSLWIVWGIGYRSCLITVAGTLPFLLLCVIINDTPPSAFPLVVLITVWITVLLSQDRPNDPPLLDATRMTLLFLSILLIFGSIGTLYPKDDTASKALPSIVEELLNRLPENIQDLLSRESTGGSEHEIGADTADTLDLTKQGVRSRTDDIMMQLCATESGVLYLRGTAKDIYTGTSWSSADHADSESAIYAHTSIGSQYSDTEQAAVQIKNYRDNATVAFTPYGYISCTGGATISSDLRVSIEENDYIIYYWPGISTLDLSSPGSNFDSRYDTYVQKYCTALPADTKAELLAFADKYGYDVTMSDYEKITWVAELIRSIGTYRLDVSRQPSNYDFALYFLEESQAGYCVHYATAACAMYRALGIPSRYASGYRVVVSEAGAVTDVTDQDTHAWPEVYISGLGWIPIEVTPGFSETTTLPEISPEYAPSLSKETSETPEPESSALDNQDEAVNEEALAPSPSPETNQQPTPSPEVVLVPPSPSPDPNEVLPNDPSELAFGHSVWLIVLVFIFIALLVAVSAIVIRRHLILSHRVAAFYSDDYTKATINVWAYAESLEPWGAVLPPDILGIALRAKFSQHSISREEYEIVLSEILSEYNRLLSTLKGIKRMKFIFISPLEFPQQ